MDYLLLIDSPNCQRCQRLFLDHEEKIITAFGSKTKHQAWKGGFKDHTEETMTFAFDLYEMYKEKRKYQFTLSDALLTLFLHDLEKPFKYTGARNDLNTDEDKWKFLQEMVSGYKLELTPQHWNALRYVHGEGDDYHPTKRIQGELAGFIHVCDTLSARVFHSEPRLSAG